MLFKILQGDSSRISTDITPLHPGWCYFTSDDGRLYSDSIDENGAKRRTCINPNSGGASVAVKGTLTKNGWVSGQQTLPVRLSIPDVYGRQGEHQHRQPQERRCE